jgi:hypothetical protein
MVYFIQLNYKKLKLRRKPYFFELLVKSVKKFLLSR